jgi:hypothetical protein
MHVLFQGGIYGETPHVRGKIHVIQTSSEDQGIDMTLVSYMDCITK